MNKLPFRDVEVRELARKKLHICKHCVNRFTKEELSYIIFKRDMVNLTENLNGDVCECCGELNCKRHEK